MSILVLGQSFEEKLSFITVKKYINSIKDRFTPSHENFKVVLKDIEKDFLRETQVLTDIQNLNREDLEFLNHEINKFNIAFDTLHSQWYDKNYYNDGEIRQLFTSISRQAHKIENISHKYLFKNNSADLTPEHIKEGLAEFSKQTLIKRI